MPMSTRRQAQAQRQQQQQQQFDRSPAADVDIASDEATHREAAPSDFDADEGDADIDGYDEAEDEEDHMPLDIDPDDDSPFPPPGLKEISSLASWTVSTAKPGNGVAALRAPDLALFWQSDGPQPHLLSIHFFKRVALAHMRVYLDYARDESYTPTRMQFLAGTGVHDVLPFAEMSFEHPTGWVDVDFSNVGPVLEDDEDEDEDDAGQREIDWSRRPVLRAFLIQVRILENHQNGKDTHLRAVQLFARDATREGRGAAVTTDEITRKVKAIALPTTAATTRRAAVPREQNNLKMASWMMDPEMR